MSQEEAGAWRAENASPASAAAGSHADLDFLALQLTELAGQLRRAARTPDDRRTEPVALTSRDTLLACARRLYDQRRRRTALVGSPDLFGEPAWDILLDLYIACALGKPVSVSSACIASAAPPTTGLRWLSILQDEGLVQREKDPQDQRRINVRLTNGGIEKMEAYLRELCEQQRQ